MKVQIIADLTFGDSGKGMVVDNLADQATHPLVIRYTGGPQAAHTVIRDGKKHIFSSFGAGTLAGAPSFFSKHTLVYLPFLLREYEVLKALGITPKLTIDPLARLITPYDIAFNQARELHVKHGSCGKGIGAAMARHEQTPYKLYALDLLHPEMLRLKLDGIADYYEKKIENMPGWEAGSLYHTKYTQTCVSAYEDFVDALNQCHHANFPFDLRSWKQVCIEEVRESSTLIFEGAQGILLDQDHGFFPTVTYGHTTTRNAWELLNIPAFHSFNEAGTIPEVFYVTRCYQTRHGGGPMTTEEKWLRKDPRINTEEEINVLNVWQDQFRVGPLDYALIRQGWETDIAYHPERVFKHIVFTCKDQLPDFQINYAEIPQDFMIWTNASPHAGHMNRVLRRKPEILSNNI